MSDDERGANSMARSVEARIAALEAERLTLPRSERRPVNQRLHELKGWLRWCKSRAGYRPTPHDVGLL